MAESQLKREILLDRPLNEVFAFFADARNLQRITPPFLKFKVLTPGEIQMAVGTHIDYRLKLHGIPLRWTSRITVWEPPFRFVDTQVRGPYSLWVHEHSFEAKGEQTIVRDHVRYAMPFLKLLDRFFIRPDLNRVFDYRGKCMQEIFPDQRKPAK